MIIRFDKGKVIFEGDKRTISHREVIRTPLEEVQGVLKCKCCGASPAMEDVDLKAGVFVCRHCDTPNTLPNFARTADGPHITSIRNTYYVNSDGTTTREQHREDRDGVAIPTAEELTPSNILKMHLQDILNAFGYGKKSKK